MDKNLKMHITIRVADNEEKMEIGNFIHSQLVGFEDYQNNNIVLNIDDDNEVNLYVFKECKFFPDIDFLP